MTTSHQPGRSCNNQHTVSHEIQICPEGEAGLGKKFDECEKNPGHEKFIPVDAFHLDHLPAGYQDQNIYDLIQCIENLTCRLVLRYVSQDRPDFFPDSDKPYTYSKHRGKEFFSTGTGFVVTVDKWTAEECSSSGKDPSCKCLDCVESNKPRKTWWEVNIDTAKHVTFDTSEARETEVDFFYNVEGRQEVKKLKGVEMLNSGNVKEDRSSFTCYTHDKKLAQRLKKMKGRFDDLNKKINEKYKAEIPSMEHQLTVIVSHPHGCPKRISLGEWKEKEKNGRYGLDYTLTYNTSTCTGSSGAMVWFIGCWSHMTFYNCNPSHSGEDGDSDLNISGTGRFILI